MENLNELEWFRSSYSSNNGGNCVELAGVGSRRAVRDSKDSDGPKHVFDGASWTAFVAAVKRGEFDLT